jgi:FkbM family methyltransferase
MTQAAPRYDEVIECNGLRIPYFKDIISERMRNLMAQNRFESGEMGKLQGNLRPTDRVLIVGAGVGLTSAFAASVVEPAAVMVLEANPELLPLIQETNNLNGAGDVTVVHGVAGSKLAAGTVRYYINDDTFASTSNPNRNPDGAGLKAVVDVPLVDLNALIAQHRPTVLVVNLQGDEFNLFEKLDLSGVRSIITELYPNVYGLRGSARIFGTLLRAGFAYDSKASRGRSSIVLSRFKKASLINTPSSPRITIVATMKNEAPFILEWIAYHRSIGVTDFLVFTNDCDDGTDVLLDRLDEMGVVRHMPNPTALMDSTYHHPTALKYGRLHKEYRNADWTIAMDVDEFVNIHVGQGHFSDLFAAMPDANLISLTQLDFGCAGVETYEDRPLIEQMHYCSSKKVGKRSRRGVKTMIHRSVPDYRFANHRPHFKDGNDPRIIWKDSAGRRVSPEFISTGAKSLGENVSYAMLQLNHYPVRSMESYLIKAARGTAVIGSFVGFKYWHVHNTNVQKDETILRRVPQMRAEMNMLLTDAVLSEIQRKVVERHKEKIQQYKADPALSTLLEDIRTDHHAVMEALSKPRVRRRTAARMENDIANSNTDSAATTTAPQVSPADAETVLVQNPVPDAQTKVAGLSKPKKIMAKKAKAAALAN